MSPVTARKESLLSGWMRWQRGLREWTARLGLAVGVLLTLLSPPAVAQAQGVESGITSPATGSAVAGDVPIFGTAVIEPFQKYELHYKAEPSGDDAYIYFDGGTQPVINGQLGVWHAGGLPPGVYSIRLRVVKIDGNYAEYFAKNLSVNLAPTPTPTPSEPTPTPIPTATFTPAPQPTPVVGEVSQPELAEPTPTPTVAVAAVLAPPADTGTDTAGAAGAGGSVVGTAGESPAVVAEPGDSVTRQLGEALSLNRLRRQFWNGVRFSAALFFGVAALYAGKRLFSWLWKQYS